MLSRRKLLHAGCAIVAVTLASHFLDQVRAWPVHGNAGVPKVIINTNFVDGATFKNWMLTFGSIQALTAGYAYPSVLNVDQYPVGTIGSAIQGQGSTPSNVTSGTTCVLAWTGTVSAAGMGIQNGSPGFTVTAGASFVSGSTAFNLNVVGTNGYIEFNWNGTVPSHFTFAFQNGATFTGLTGLILCVKSDYASIIAATNAGQLIAPAYVSAMAGLSPKAVRPMSWSNPNGGNNLTQHQYRMNWQTVLNYSSNVWIPNCWAGSSSGTNAYTASAATDTPAAYTMGEVLQLQFINASTTGTQTINVGARGIVPLFNMFGSALASNAIAANALATLIYDDLLGGYLVTFSGLTGNVPVEVQIGLANQLGCPLWYNFPPHITYQNSTMEPTNSVTQIAALIASTLTSGCYFEYANEVWNSAAGFQHTSWAANCGAALGFPNTQPNNYDSFYGFRVATIMPLVVTAWGVKSGLKCVSAFQAFGGSTNVSDHRLKGTDLASVANGGQGNVTWISYTGNANFTASPNRPVDVTDTLAYATYYSGAQCANFDANYINAGGTGLTTGGPSGWTTGLLGAADAYAAGGATNIANAIAFLDWDIRQGINNGAAGGQTLLALLSGAGGTGIYPRWETVAASFDGAGRPAGKTNLTVECYEGAMECAPPSTARCTALSISTSYGGATGLIGNLLTAYKNSSTFYATVQKQFNDFFASSHSKSANWFEFSGGDQWSMYQGDVYQPAWQSYAAVQNYNRTL